VHLRLTSTKLMPPEFSPWGAPAPSEPLATPVLIC